jgi:hypothetical protein
MLKGEYVMFWLLYFGSLIAWFAGYLPISGWWFVAIPFLLPLVAIVISVVFGAAWFGTVIGIASVVEWFENR